MSRELAHSYMDELYEPIEMEYEPIIGSWADVVAILFQSAIILFVLTSLFVCLFLMGMGVEGPRP